MFDYIFLEKFKNGTAQDHFKKCARSGVEACFEWVLENQGDKAVEKPNKDSTFEEKTLESLKAVDQYFGSKLFHKIEPYTPEGKIVETTPSPLPSVQLSGKYNPIKI